MKQEIKDLYDLWLKKTEGNAELHDELSAIEGKEDEISDRFYRALEFGTGGLRGVLGAGTNRMNVFTVNQATQGLADYLNAKYDSPSVAIAHDSRINSDVFAKGAAGVLAANGIKSIYLSRIGSDPDALFRREKAPLQLRHNNYREPQPREVQRLQVLFARGLSDDRCRGERHIRVHQKS